MSAGNKKHTKSKIKQKRRGGIEESRKMRWGKHLQAAFQSIIISRVLDMRERERVQFCSGYHYHHSHNHNQGNSSVARWKGGWQRVREEDEMSDRRNEDITGSNHGETYSSMSTRVKEGQGGRKIKRSLK